MSWSALHPALWDSAAAIVALAVHWFLQSTVLIALGLVAGRLLARRGSAVQSAVYRTTLAAALVCPLASVLLSQAGISGWSLPIQPNADHAPLETGIATAVHTTGEAGVLATPTLPLATSPSALPAAGKALAPAANAPASISPRRGPDPADSRNLSPAAKSAPSPAEWRGRATLASSWLTVAIAAAWMVISAAMLARLALAWGQLVLLRRQAVPAEAATREICHELAGLLAVSAPQVLRSPYVPSPCLAGLRRPAVLLPEADPSLQMRDVLVHELAHLVRRDCHWNLLRQLTLSALFFQPVLWLLSRRLEAAAEEVCDDFVVQYGGDRYQYAHRLVDVAELCTAPMAAAGVGIVSLRSMLARRVLRIMDTSRSLSTRVGNALLALVVVGGLVGTLLAGLVGIGPRQSGAADAPATGKEDQGNKPPGAATAAEPTAATKPVVAPAVVAAGTLAFERDSVQLSVDAFDVWSLSFADDDRILAASGGGDWTTKDAGYARIWDLVKNKEIASYPASRGIGSISLSPDGRRVALGSWSGDIWLREVGGAELMHEKLSNHLRAAFSPDGKLLVGVSGNNQLRTWDGVTGRSLEKENDAQGNPIPRSNGAFRGGTFSFNWIGFSPDGKYLVACGGKGDEPEGVKFAVWSVTSRQQIYKQRLDMNRIFSASISPDSQTLATSGETSVVLWDLATGVRRTETEETGGAVYRVEFSPDGKLLASASSGNDQAVKLWDTSSGKLASTLSGHQGMVRAMAFTRDGKTLVTGGADRTLRLWDVVTGQQTSLLQSPKKAPGGEDAPAAILAAACASDGNSLATAGEDGRINVYGRPPAGMVRSWVAHADGVAALAYSPDGKTLVSGGYDKLVKFWNPATGEEIRTLAGHTGWVLALAFSHDGQTLASGSYDRSIRLWNVADGQERRTLSGHLASVRGLAFSHDDRLLASGSSDQRVRLWDPASGEQKATLAGHEGTVRGVAFSPDDRLLASGGEDQAINVWDVASHELHGTLTGHTDMVSAIAFAQQTLVSVGWDHTLRTWDARALQQRAKLTVGGSELVALAVAADGHRLMTVGADQSLTLWKATAVEGERSGPLGDYRAYPWAADFSPDGGSVAVVAGGEAAETDFYLYDVATKAEKYKVTFPDSVRSLAFAPAGDLIALGFARKRVLLIDAATGNEVAELEPQPANAPQAPNYRFARVAFSPDGKLLAASAYGDEIRIYDVERRELVQTLKGRADRILSFAFSPDKKQLISCSAGKPATLWDLSDASRNGSLPALREQRGVASVSYSPDGKLLATGYSSDTCRLRDAKTGNVLHTLQAHDGIVFESVFAPDGKLLATSGEDGLVKLWDVATGKLVRTYDCQSGPALYVRFSPDGKSLVTASKGGQVKLWWVLPVENN